MNTKYSTYKPHMFNGEISIENKENTLYQSSTLQMTPLQQSKNNNNNSQSAQNGRYSIYQDEMNVDHSVKNQNSGESAHNI